jgi:o-succinylbenzoate synthase
MTASGAALESITLHRLGVPLSRPYRLAFGPVEHYDTILVELADTDGAVGLGEATVLTGYTDETIEESWRVAREFAAALAPRGAAKARARIVALGQRYPFTATAFGTAFDMLDRHGALDVRKTTRVPLLGLMHGEDEASIEREFEELLAAGFRTIKVKVGFDARHDAQRVRSVQRVAAGRALIRIDANQGYSADEGIAFVRAVDPQGIELFEQPCAAGDWEAHRAVARASSVPMMLDESIYGLADIERAAKLRAADYIKLKLMKLGTLDALIEAIERIRSLGMRPVLGNGVACDVGCWMEACVAARTIDNAGEMNGFLKGRGGLLADPLAFRDGAIVLEPGYTARPDHERIAQYVIESARYPVPMRRRGASAPDAAA